MSTKLPLSCTCKWKRHTYFCKGWEPCSGDSREGLCQGCKVRCLSRSVELCSIAPDGSQRRTNSYHLPSDKFCPNRTGREHPPRQRRTHDVLSGHCGLGGVDSSHSDSSWICSGKYGGPKPTHTLGMSPATLVSALSTKRLGLCFHF